MLRRTKKFLLLTSKYLTSLKAMEKQNLKKSNWKRIKELVIQLIPIAIGVYLGIVAGNWNERYNHRQDQKVFLKNLVLELESNKRKIENAQAYHKKLGETMDSLYQIVEEEEWAKTFMKAGGFSFFPGWTGVRIPTLERSVYETGIVRNLMDDLEFGLINKIARTYSYQQNYKEITRPLTNRILNISHQTTLMEMAMVITFFGGDISLIEQNMVETYEAIIELLNKELS